MHVVPKCMPWRFGASYSLGSVPLVMRVSKALFSLMTINIKMETALVKQGHYIVQVSGMDVATMAEENRVEVEVINDGGDTGPAPL